MWCSIANATNYGEAGNAVKDALITKYEIKKYVDNLQNYVVQKVGADKTMLWMALGYKTYQNKRVEFKWKEKTFEIGLSEVRINLPL